MTVGIEKLLSTRKDLANVVDDDSGGHVFFGYQRPAPLLTVVVVDTVLPQLSIATWHLKLESLHSFITCAFQEKRFS